MSGAGNIPILPGMATPSSSGPPEALVAALRRALRPLVRMLLDHQLTLPFVVGLLKEVLVEVASRDFAGPGGAITDSRITLLTGVHRKDVRRLRRPVDLHPAPRAVSMAALVVARWQADERYLDARGQPLALERGGARPNFESLVDEVSGQDVRPAAVLQELQRLGVVKVSDGRVALDMEAFVPDEDFDQKAWYFGESAGDHLAACGHNLRGGQPPLLERSVYYTDLPDAAVDELAGLARSEGMQALKSINRRAHALKKNARVEPAAAHRFRFGVYFYREPVQADARKPEGLS